jgi:uncharacterized repeat protein (TIGR01451 family)
MVAILPLVGWADVTPYSQDFEGLALPSPGALLGDDWLVFGNVYDAGGVYQYGYGPFPAPNDGAAFCAVVAGEGGPAQGNQQLSVYSDYNNTAHGNLDWVIETNVYKEQTIDASAVGKTVFFTFDAKLGNLEGGSEAEAFIKTLDPAAGWTTTNHVTVDTTGIPTTWGTYEIELTIDGGLVGQVLQFGFTTRASNYESSGIIYDNVNFDVPSSSVTLRKSSSFILELHDHDGSGDLTPGDTLLYSIVATNNDTGNALEIVVSDTPDPNTTLTTGTTTTTQGVIVSGNTGGDTTVNVDVGTLAGGASAEITFEVTINDPLPGGVTSFYNQATLTGAGIGAVPSNTTVNTLGEGGAEHPIPTLSTWRMIIFALLIAGAAVWKLRF